MQLRLALLDAFGSAPYGHGPGIYGPVLRVLFAAFLATTLWPTLAGAMGWRPDRRLAHAVVHCALMTGVIFWARWPGLLPPWLNPDEGLFAAAAVRLLNDPVFWRSVDTGSSGPVNIFPLTLASLVGLKPDLASARLIGLLLIIASAVLLYAALRQVFSDAAARLATLPVATTIALMQDPDFVHYSGEHMPTFLLSAMVLLLFRVAGNPTTQIAPGPSVFCFGLLAGLMPFAKMQGAPIAFALGLCLIHLLWSQGRNRLRPIGPSLALLVGGGALPSLLMALFLSINAIWPLFWHSYLQTNLFFYAGLKGVDAWSKARDFVSLSMQTQSIYQLTVTTGAICVVGLGWAATTRRKPTMAKLSRRPYAIYALVYLAAAAFAAAKPGNPFRHYLLFLIMPLGLLIGAVGGEIDRSASQKRRGLQRAWQGAVVAVLLLCTSLPVAERAKIGNQYLAHGKQFPVFNRNAVVASIRKAAPPGSSMSVWGFSPELFIDSNMVQATRYGCTVWQIEPNPLQSDFIEEWVKDFEAARPRLFVDAMANGMFYPLPVDRARNGHDAFPRVAATIEKDYDLVDEVRGVRIYRRRAAS